MFDSISKLRSLFQVLSVCALSPNLRILSDGHVFLRSDLFGEQMTKDGLFDTMRIEIATGHLLSISLDIPRLLSIRTIGRWVYTHLILPIESGDTYVYAKVGSGTPSLVGLPRRYVDVIFPRPPVVMHGISGALAMSTEPIIEAEPPAIALLPDPIIRINPPEALRKATVRIMPYMLKARWGKEEYPSWVEESEEEIGTTIQCCETPQMR